MSPIKILLICSWATLTSAATNCRDLKVQPINELPEPYKGTVDAGFYNKFTNANGIPIMSSDGVSDYALQECARIIRGVTSNLKNGFLDALINKKQRIALWASDSNACSIPETAKPCTLQDFHGGLTWGNILILQETTFDCDDRGNAWIGRVLVHEFNHAVNGVFDRIDADLQKSLDNAYNNAKSKQLWPPNEYAMTNAAEYFAIGAQTWFEANEKRHCDMGACDRKQLQSKDEQLYNLLARIYNQPNWLYKCDEACERVQEPNKNCVTAFEDREYQGKQKSFCGNVQLVGRDWNDKISSIKVPSGCTVDIFDDIHFRGQTKAITQDAGNLRDVQMNDRISSLKIRC